MKQYIIDSNIFLRFFDSSSSNYLACQELISLIDQGRIRGIICSVILLEVYFTLLRFYKLPKKDCQTKITRLLTNKNLMVNDNFNYKKIINLYQKYNVSLADCFISSLKLLEKRVQLISYDKDFDKLGVKRLEPKDF